MSSRRTRTVILRQQYPGLKLTIIGTWDRHARRYFDELSAQASSLGSWIEFRHDLSRDEVRGLMATCRYGIHGMREEHFGMAPAELVRAGQIVWLPKGGGQMEIVGEEPMLMYETEDEAVEKIVAVMGNAAEQERLRRLLAQRGELFSTDRFIKEIREIVSSFS